jgi:hypothetical protein
MALSEPVGGGLFTSNIVFAAVVLLSTRNQALQVHKALLLKDLLFYLLALVTILVAISDSKVRQRGGGARRRRRRVPRGRGGAGASSPTAAAAAADCGPTGAGVALASHESNAVRQ